MGLSSAPRAVVRAHVPWHWRILGAIVVLSASLAGAGWMYDAGRRIAGFERSETEQEMRGLRERVAELEQEVAQLRAVANSSESNLQIERAAQQQLARQLAGLQEENGRLKEELAFFENLAAGEGKDGQGPTINRLQVTRDSVVPQQYRYRLLVAMQGGKKGEREFRGKLQLVIHLQREGKSAMMVLPAADESNPENFNLHFKHFQRVDGTFRVPSGAQVTTVEVRLLQDGATRATQTVTL
ncbi:MAG: DUF6776 family protein [Pseudomonadota bacterium]|jgi:hypothetical protein